MIFLLNTRTKIRIAQLLYRAVSLWRRLLGKTDIATVDRGGIRWRLDLREGIDLSIYLFGYFERDTTRAYRGALKPGDTVLDIGANIGAHTLPFARCVAPHGKVIAFEPTAYAHAKLRTNLQLNPHLDAIVKLEQIMLAETSNASMATTIYSSWPLGGSGTEVHPKHRGLAMTTDNARVASVDDYVARSNIARINFVKLDVDGYECSVLRGAQRTLQRDLPTILMEIMPYGLTEQGSSLDELFGILVPLGYALYDLNGDSLPADRSLSDRVPPEGGINVIWRHPR